MKRLLIAVLATAALAIPATASAHGRGHHWRGGQTLGIRLSAVQHGIDLGFFAHASRHGTDMPASTGVFERLVGTGASFGTGAATATGTISGRPLEGGTYSATVTTDWTKAATGDNGASCAPATATVSLVDVLSSANTLGESVTGKTCSVPSNDRNIAYVFFGTSTVSGATGTLSGATGTGRVLLVQKTDESVRGFVFSGFHGAEEHSFVSFAAHDRASSCDGH